MVDHVWKRFRRDRHSGTLRGELRRLRARGRAPSRWRWALRDVDFVVEPGEAVGVVGVNGAGKTTLLRLLNRVMYPYAGRIDVTGRTGALLEVRGGLHPELTGAENVYFVGAMLGLRRREIGARFAEIVEFAELQDALDRQVKFYSSGMQMRLGFSVAAHLDPDVLLVDEVLAVGDTAFQERCLERMRDVLTRGTTLLLVSHDLAAVRATCRRAIWLEGGLVAADGPVGPVLDDFRATVTGRPSGGPTGSFPRAGTGTELRAVDVDGLDGTVPTTGRPLHVGVTLEVHEPHWGLVCIGIGVDDAPVVIGRHDLHLDPGPVRVECRFGPLPLPRGRYEVSVGVFGRRGETRLPWEPSAAFELDGPGLDPLPPGLLRAAPVHVTADWTITWL